MGMNITRAKAPSAEAVEEIEELARDCDRFDGTSTEVDHDTTLNFHRDMDSWFLLREDGGSEGSRPRLEAFLMIFAPEERVAEITVMVRPGARRRGLSSRLLAEAEGLLDGFGYRELLFLRDVASVPGGAAIESLRASRGASLDHREFSMLLPERLVAGGERGAQGGRGLAMEAAIAPATAGDLGEMAALASVVYGDSEEESRRFLEATMAIPARSLLVARRTGQVLGMVSVFAEEGISSINALAVAPTVRRRGLGSALLDEAIRAAASKGARHIGLEVDAENRGALGIYLGRGFEITCEIEYWRAPLEAR